MRVRSVPLHGPVDVAEVTFVTVVDIIQDGAFDRSTPVAAVPPRYPHVGNENLAAQACASILGQQQQQ